MDTLRCKDDDFLTDSWAANSSGRFIKVQFNLTDYVMYTLSARRTKGYSAVLILMVMVQVTFP